VTGRAGGIVVSALFTAVLIAGVYAAGPNRKVLVLALVLAGLALLGSWSVVFSHLRTVQAVQMGLAGIFYAYLTFVVLRAVLRAPKVTADTLYAAASVYLLLGFAWATLYAILEGLQPGSLSFAATAGRYAEPAFFDLVYYSFVTLTTLGYGEITPIAPLARSLAVLEAAGGVLYLAFLVARLVTLYERDRHRSGAE
jgi:hypothetical protein